MIICKIKQNPLMKSGLAKLAIRTLSSRTSWSVQEFLSSSFKKFRFHLRYLFGGRKVPKFSAQELKQKRELFLKQIHQNSNLLRLIFRQREHVKNFYANSFPFRSFNRRIFNGTTITFGIVGIGIKYDNDNVGHPNWSKTFFQEKKEGLDFQDYFKTVDSPVFEADVVRNDIRTIDRIEFNDYIAKGCCGAVHKAKIPDLENSDVKQDVAVKIIFNYEMGSDSAAIIRSTLKECVPYTGSFGCDNFKRKVLPSHPNIVKILSVFVDQFKILAQSKNLYPHALPESFDGFGHSKTLYVMQKLYDYSLKDYLDNHQPSNRCSLAILTQCFEAIDFLHKNQVAHRDLKLDNILVDCNDPNEHFPWIVITDFGLCSTSLKIPYESEEVLKGGNQALMAPEIKNAQPSKTAILDYDKSDLWSMGTMAYEIFGGLNPFYRKRSGQNALDGATYEEKNVPEFPFPPPLLAPLIRNILRRNPQKRPSVSFVSAFFHLLFQYGSIDMENLLLLKNLQIRDSVLEQWFKRFSHKTVFQLVNNGALATNAYKMRILFLSKYNSSQLIGIMNEARKTLV